MTQSTRISRQQLYRRVWSKPRVGVAADLGISFTALGRLCDRLLIPYPSRDYWSKNPSERPPPPPLPRAPADVPDMTTIRSPEGQRSRRTLSRLTRSARREQILYEAVRLLRVRGLSNVTINTIARELGLSEALIYTYFSSATDLFAEIAKIELQVVYDRGVDAMREVSSHRVGSFNLTSETIRQAQERGAILDILLADPQIRSRVREESRAVRTFMTEQRALSAMQTYGVPFDVAHAQMHILFGMTVRVSRWVGRKLIDPDSALRICMAVQQGGIIERFRSYHEAFDLAQPSPKANA